MDKKKQKKRRELLGQNISLPPQNWLTCAKVSKTRKEFRVLGQVTYDKRTFYPIKDITFNFHLFLIILENDEEDLYFPTHNKFRLD